MIGTLLKQRDPLRALDDARDGERSRLEALQDYRRRTETERDRLNEILRQTDVMINAKRAELEVLQGSIVDVDALELEIVGALV